MRIVNPGHYRLLVASLVALAACGDDGPAGLRADEGEIRFAYSGVASGTFAARGTFDEEAELPFGTWSVGARDSDTLVVGGLRARTAPNGDAVGLFIPGVTGPVTRAVSFTCSAQCPLFVFVLNGDLSQRGPTAEPSFDWGCLLVDGTIRVDAISASRARGTFSGTAGCIDEGGLEGGEIEVMTIANGTFDVPIRDVTLPIGDLPFRR